MATSTTYPFEVASALRWLSVAAGRQQAARVVGEHCVEQHIQLQRLASVLQDSVGSEAAAGASDSEASVKAASSEANRALEVAGLPKELAEAATGAASSGAVHVLHARDGISPGEHSVKNSALLRMAENFGRYWGYVVTKRQDEARRSLCFALQSFRLLYWNRPAWRGANLGGWLLLEPGPASPFFETCRARIGEVYAKGLSHDSSKKFDDLARLEDEHSLCDALQAALGPALKDELFHDHRSTHYDSRTFDDMCSMGLNAVRLPFGHWIVSGPCQGEAYVGPALDVLDRAVQMAEERGLQVVLDLHGNPGGENGKRPCGRQDRNWRWAKWRQDETLRVLQLIAERYKDACSVTGLQVCNEPCESIPIPTLCGFYEKAIMVIRGAGMEASKVAVILPIFTHFRITEVISFWHEQGNFLKYDNVCFDVHYYHDFFPIWRLLSQEQHLDVVAEHARELKLLPGAVVGEWSLSRPPPYKRPPFTNDDGAGFAAQQVLAYNHASHGWFFWNWNDHDHLPDWDFARGVFGRGLLPVPLGQREREGVLFPEWEGDSWSSVPRKPLPRLWPWIFSWVPWVKPCIRI